MSNTYNFGPAPGDEIVYGAASPRYGNVIDADSIQAWIAFMRTNGIGRVVCLDEDRDGRLMGEYQRAWGRENVLYTPVRDFTLPSEDDLKTIMAFLDESNASNARSVIHCGAGIGRTGFVLAAWLVHSRSLAIDEAIDEVNGDAAHRQVEEAVDHNGVTEEDVRNRLLSVRRSGS